MDEKPSDCNLLLPDLYIENFRGIKKLSIPRLGRVTLLAGFNGVGKTTALEAVEVYAGRARYPVLRDILIDREEVSHAADGDRETFMLHEWETFFHGREITENARAKLGPRQVENQLCLKPVSFDRLMQEGKLTFDELFPELPWDADPHTLKASFQGNTEIIPALLFGDKNFDATAVDPSKLERELAYWARRYNSQKASSILCERIGPGQLKYRQLTKFWGNVALTVDEAKAVQALRIAYGDEVDRVSLISDGAARNSYGAQKAIVKLRDQDDPVSLRSLGDGTARLFGVALALANCRNGFLLIDEVENGLHYYVHREYWRMVFRTAHENNVQVFATTHSWDIVRGFARAATENENVEGVLVRLEKEEDGIRCVRYTERTLKIAADHGTDVR